MLTVVGREIFERRERKWLTPVDYAAHSIDKGDPVTTLHPNIPMPSVTVKPREWRDVTTLAQLNALVMIAGVILLGITATPLSQLLPIAARFMVAMAALGTAIALATTYVCFRESRAIPNAAFVARLALAGLLVALTISVFGIFKQMVLPMRGFPLDPALARLDRWLLLGHDAWAVSHALTPGIWATIVYDRLYSVWMLAMVLFPMVAMVAIPRSDLRVRLVTCWLASWIIVGGLLAWMLGSAGPCYYTALIGPDAGFALLDQRLGEQLREATAMGSNIDALSFQPKLLSVFGSETLAPAGGISAMPSMHVAMAALFAIGGFQVRNWLGWIATVYCALIWIGSVHLGWHYFADGLVSILVMLALWRGSAMLHRA